MILLYYIVSDIHVCVLVERKMTTHQVKAFCCVFTSQLL